jgi:hypothetical protein
MKPKLQIPHVTSPFFVLSLLGAFSLCGSMMVAQAQYTVQNPYMRLLFDDGFGNVSYNVVTPGTDPNYGDPLPAGSVTSANGLLMPVSNGWPLNPYTFTQDTSSGGTANGASVNVNYVVYTYGPLSNNFSLPFGSVGKGVSSGGLTQYLISGTKSGPARLRMDWTIEYINNTLYSINMNNGAAASFLVNLPNSGNYGQFRYHDVLTPTTGPTLTIDNQQPGDTPSTGYVSGSFWRVNPITIGSHTDWLWMFDPSQLGSVNYIPPGASYTEQGYVDIEADPASVQFNVQAVPQLAIAHATGNNFVVSWSSSATGFNLQTNTDLNTSNWGNYGGPVNDNGPIKSVTAILPSKKLFFRLSTP